MKKRSCKQEDWDASDPVNQALSEGNALLYGICHAAIISLGYSAGLGFIHTGKQLSFVYDIADLYKAATTIPAAFGVVKKSGDLTNAIRYELTLVNSNPSYLVRMRSAVRICLAALFEA